MRLLISILAALVLAGNIRVAAQVAVELSFDQKEYLPGETVVAVVKVVNRSGQTLTLGGSGSWLVFNVEAVRDSQTATVEGAMVRQLQDLPVTGVFDLASSQQAVKRVDLEPCFDFRQLGRYKVTAVVHIAEWGQDFSSKPLEFSVIPGAKLWEQSFGVAAGPGRAPEMRKYLLDEASYFRTHKRLYVSIKSDDDAHIYKVIALGPKVSFGFPETQVDGAGRLHVLWQSGASIYSYNEISPEGGVLQQEFYDYVTSRPRLTVDGKGEVVVLGGVRRLKPVESPVVHPPNELPPVNLPPANRP